MLIAVSACGKRVNVYVCGPKRCRLRTRTRSSEKLFSRTRITDEKKGCGSRQKFIARQINLSHVGIWPLASHNKSHINKLHHLVTAEVACRPPLCPARVAPANGGVFRYAALAAIPPRCWHRPPPR
jgi:hypothetical protein